MKKFIKEIYNQLSKYYQRRSRTLEEFGIFNYAGGNRGYVLIIVLIISTLLVSVSTNFLVNAQTNINYMKKFKNEAQAESIAYAGLNLAHIILDVDQKGTSIPMLPIKNKNKNIDSFGDIWALDFPEFELGNGTVKIIIEDEQSKINISAVSTKYVQQTTFFSILNRFFLNMGYPTDYADAVVDWVDQDKSKTGSGAETYDYYSTLSTPYSAQDDAMDSIDQLLLVRYFTPDVYYGFSGGNKTEEIESDILVDSNDERSSLDILALMESPEETDEDDTDTIGEEVPIGPERSRQLSEYLRVNGDLNLFNSQSNKININTASYRVLRAIAPDMNDNDVKQIILRRRNSPFTNVDDAKEFIRDELIRKNCLTTHSNLFRITIHGYMNSHRVTITAVFDRTLKHYYYFALH
jgi:type II secretory pathway component PulK